MLRNDSTPSRDCAWTDNSDIHHRTLYLARGLRGFGDGFAIIILPAYMTALGYDAARVGLVATASLLGTAVLTLAVGLIAPRHDIRALMLFGAALTAATGLAFPNVEQFVLIAAVAFIGTINPSGGDLGVLVPLEHAMLARGAASSDRTRIFARYSLIGALSMAAGSLASSLPDALAPFGIANLAAFRLMFYAYAALGLICGLIYLRLPRAQGEEQHHAPLGPSRAHRLQAGGAVLHRCVRRRLHRAVAAGAVAVPALRPVAVGGRLVLLLVEHAWRLLLSGRGMDRQTRRPRQHHGVHPHSLERVPDPGGVRAQSLRRARPAAAARGAVADGCADAHLLRDGGGDAGGAAGGGERHRRAAQPGLRDQSRRFQACC